MVIDVPDIPAGIVPTSDLLGATNFPPTYKQMAAAPKAETTNVQRNAFRIRRRSSIKRIHATNKHILRKKLITIHQR
jgi:hypothetical protein